MLYGTATRSEAWDRAQYEAWDVIVVGGGITGAGILREGVRLGLRVLLLEMNDFASGTSSRSSKLVHGGLRYLNNMQFGMTRQSVIERETLLSEGAGLVDRLPFLYPTYEDDKMPDWMMGIGLWLYAWVGGRWRVHQDLDPLQLQMMAPGLSGDHLTGGFRFYDAQTDDARLVLRVIREGTATGLGVAINYARVEGLLRSEHGDVTGVRVVDAETGQTHEIKGRAVVNATGAWADELRAEVGAEPRIRPLRGSHLVFDPQRFPVYQAVSFPHPDDGRFVFVFPWEGVTLLGTTDLDHGHDLSEEPCISPEEVSYLLGAVQHHFPGLGLTTDDVIATFAGVRPVVDSGHEVEPSKESREHVLWNEDGLLTVTGGKLTTFRCIALDALKALRKRLPGMPDIDEHLSALDAIPSIDAAPAGLSDDDLLRLVARYGPEIVPFVAECPLAKRARIGRHPVHWLELRWAARHEAVHHLDDLLLRRVRLGLLLDDGGEHLLEDVRALVQSDLGWDDLRWAQEAARYVERWRTHYGVPATLDDGLGEGIAA